MMVTSAGVLLYGQIPDTSPPGTGNVLNILVMRVGTQILTNKTQELVEEAIEPVHKLWELDAVGIKEQEVSYEDTATLKTL